MMIKNNKSGLKYFLVNIDISILISTNIKNFSFSFFEQKLKNIVSKVKTYIQCIYN